MFLIHKLETLERLRIGSHFYKEPCGVEHIKTGKLSQTETEWLLIKPPECFQYTNEKHWNACKWVHIL